MVLILMIQNITLDEEKYRGIRIIRLPYLLIILQIKGLVCKISSNISEICQWKLVTYKR